MIKLETWKTRIFEWITPHKGIEVIKDGFVRGVRGYLKEEPELLKMISQHSRRNVEEEIEGLSEYVGSKGTIEYYGKRVKWGAYAITLLFSILNHFGHGEVLPVTDMLVGYVPLLVVILTHLFTQYSSYWDYFVESHMVRITGDFHRNPDKIVGEHMWNVVIQKRMVQRHIVFLCGVVLVILPVRKRWVRNEIVKVIINDFEVFEDNDKSVLKSKWSMRWSLLRNMRQRIWRDYIRRNE